MSFVGDLRTVLRERWFRRLYATRLISQGADGIFQASLAAAVLFNPEHQADATQVAAGFVVLLLPYSLVGPFTGVFIDRWRRQRILVGANMARVAFVGGVVALLLTRGPAGPAFYGVALAALSVNRFYLATLSAALPHVVTRTQLVVGNSVSTTSGTLATLVGGGAALAARAVVGEGDSGSAVVAGTAALVYLLSAATAASMASDLLGPSTMAGRAPLRQEFARALRELAEGASHVWRRPRAAAALGAISAHRFFYGLSLIATLLVYRNYFQDGAVLKAGLAGLGEVFAAATIGVVLGALLTPPVSARISKESWIVVLYAGAAFVEVVFGLPYTKGSFLIAAFLLGIVAQGSKISVDTIVQEAIADVFRGRVFACYDTLFNLLFVLAALTAAFVLPESGVSYPLLGFIAAGYAATALAYRAVTRQQARASPVASVTPIG